MLWDTALRVLGAEGTSLAACLLPDTQPCEHTWPSRCILYLPSFNKERVISEYVVALLLSHFRLTHTHTKIKGKVNAYWLIGYNAPVDHGD